MKNKYFELAFSFLIIFFLLVPVLPGQDSLKYYNDAQLVFGNLEKAARELEISLKKNPANPDTHFLLGLVYEKLFKYEEAIKEFKSVLKLSPQAVIAHNELATIYIKTNKYRETIGELKKALKKDPDYSLIHTKFGDLYLKLATKEYQKALKKGKKGSSLRKYEKLLLANVEDPESKFQLAPLYLEERREKKGLALLRELADTGYKRAEKYFLSEKRIPDALISLSGYGIVCDKSADKLYLYASAGGPLRLVKSFSCSTGERDGDKLVAGDRKTPEGVYFFRRKLTKGILPKHGIMAFPLNYPNLIDRISGKNGDGIWLHGISKKFGKERKLPSTQGCVALRNKDLLELSRIIRLKSTPFVIINKISYSSPETIGKKSEKINSFISSWKAAWESKNVGRYLSFYSQDFHSRSMERKKWGRYKEKVISDKKFIRLKIENLKILKYDKVSASKSMADGEIVVCSFNQYYSSDRFKDWCKKVLYLKKQSGNWKILGEEIL